MEELRSFLNSHLKNLRYIISVIDIEIFVIVTLRRVLGGKLHSGITRAAIHTIEALGN